MSRITVLLPVYNVEPYVAEALASIQSQTFSDIEVVVVDDCSTDATTEIIAKAALDDPRFKIYRTPRNLGLVGALNYGLQFCNAPFIARMDGDDIAMRTRLEKQLAFLHENPAVAIVGCATIAIDQFGKDVPGLGVSGKPVNDEQVARTMFLASPCLHIWMARSEVYRDLSGYREMATAEDYDFLLRALSAGYHISNLPEPLMLIRTRPGNISSRLEQRKSHYFIAKLHRARLRSGQDSFSPEAYQRAIQVHRGEEAAFRLATRCVQLGIHSRNWFKRCFWVALSAALSPWQARYFFDRIRFRVAMRTR